MTRKAPWKSRSVRDTSRTGSGRRPATMASSRHSIGAVMIAGTQGPLPVKKDYIVQWNGRAVCGHIRSIRKRLESPFVNQSSESLLHPRELAWVEIGIRSSVPVQLQRGQQVAFIEPV